MIELKNDQEFLFFFFFLIPQDKLHELCRGRISGETRVINYPPPSMVKHEKALIDRSSGQKTLDGTRTIQIEKTLMSANSRFSVFAISMPDRMSKNRSSITKGRALS